MEAGICIGVTGIGDCSGTGWTPNYLLDNTLLGYVGAYSLIATEQQVIMGGRVTVTVFTETVCPYCLLDRADAAGIPGFNNQKYARIKSYLDGLYCLSRNWALSHPRRWPTHTHEFNFVTEDVWPARSDKPQLGERGF